MYNAKIYNFLDFLELLKKSKVDRVEEITYNWISRLMQGFPPDFVTTKILNCVYGRQAAEMYNIFLGNFDLYFHSYNDYPHLSEVIIHGHCFPVKGLTDTGVWLSCIDQHPDFVQKKLEELRKNLYNQEFMVYTYVY